jgi:hypothetical protein
MSELLCAQTFPFLLLHKGERAISVTGVLKLFKNLIQKIAGILFLE